MSTTIQTPAAFTGSKITNVDYTAAATGSLPKIPNTEDTIEYIIIGKGTGAALDINHGATSIFSLGTTGNGTDYPVSVKVVNQGGGSFLVIARGSGYPTITVDTTNDYATNNIVTTMTPVQASGKYLVIGS